jgi:predicted Zn-dependent protease
MAYCAKCGSQFPEASDRFCRTCGAAAAESPEPAQAVSTEPPPRLPKHRYPIAIVLAALFTVLAAGYTFVQAPTLVQAARDMRVGEADMAGHDYETAAVTLGKAHRTVPTSRKITIDLAEADFGAGEPDAAMRLLRNMRLSPSEWQTLTQTMPADYQKYFVPTKSGS